MIKKRKKKYGYISQIGRHTMLSASWSFFTLIYLKHLDISHALQGQETNPLSEYISFNKSPLMDL